MAVSCQTVRGDAQHELQRKRESSHRETALPAEEEADESAGQDEITLRRTNRRWSSSPTSGQQDAECSAAQHPGNGVGETIAVDAKHNSRIAISKQDTDFMEYSNKPTRELNAVRNVLKAGSILESEASTSNSH